MHSLVHILRLAGSLWLAALLLLLLLLSMACATVYESAHGSARALASFYHAWWFEGLLALLCVNILCSLVMRLNSWRRQLGFLIAHLSILLIIIGAWVTQTFGIDGQLRLGEGQTAASFFIPTETLKAIRPHNRMESEIVLRSAAFRGFKPVDRPAAPVLTLGDVRFTIERYLPDSEWRREVREVSDSTQPSAIEVSLGSGETADAVWIFEQRGESSAEASVLYRRFPDADAVSRALAATPAPPSTDSKGKVRISADGRDYVYALEECLERTVTVGELGYQVKVLRYLPHASIGDDRKLTNASDQPVNPAIEVELSGAGKVVRRVAFSRFPGFMHGEDELSEVQLVFETAAGSPRRAPLEILHGPGGEFYARFEMGDEPVRSVRMELGVPAETPWFGWTITILRYFEHARTDWQIEPVATNRSERRPAVLVRSEHPRGAEELWLRKYEPRQWMAGEVPLQLLYADQEISLGFGVRLNKLTIGRYPGETMPRSYESQITTIASQDGREQNHVISMNNPVKYGGYKFFQSAVSQDERGTPHSVLGVSRDPGQIIVFAGYVLLMLGLLILLITRMAERRFSRPETAPLIRSAAGG